MRRAVLGVVVALATSGCFTGLGPRAIHDERPDYNQEIAGSADRELLLNLVRLRYNESPLFLELGAVVTQYGLNANVSATGHVGDGATGDIGTGLGFTESPTVTYTPLGGVEFATRMLTPIPLDAIMLFEQSGWSAERLLLLAVQRVNDVRNAPTASGPTPESPPDYERFAELAQRLEHLREAGLIALYWEPKEGEKAPPGRDPRFSIRTPVDLRSPEAADIAAVRRLLDLAPGREEFRLTAFPIGRGRDEVGMRCRSLLGLLYFLAMSVEPPAADAQAGIVTVTREADGRPFDWTRVTGKIMRIRSREKRPRDAYLAVEHRGTWFYIANDDQTSKATFSLVNILFSLQSAEAKGKSPVLTLPVGR